MKTTLDGINILLADRTDRQVTKKMEVRLVKSTNQNSKNKNA